jgi:hypothetical protein
MDNFTTYDDALRLFARSSLKPFSLGHMNSTKPPFMFLLVNRIIQ